MAPNRGSEHPELRRRVDATLDDTAGFTVLVSSGRSYDQQKALYDLWMAGRGNLAANPDSFNATTGRRGSNHQAQSDGRSYAVDISVSPRTEHNKFLLEEIANSHGLCRTVPSEYWHFEIMRPDGRAHRYGDPVASWTGGRPAIESCRGDRGSEVEHLQILLTGAGLLAGDRDGIFGPATESAVREWQRRLGVSVTGCWDAETEAATTEVLDGLGPGGPTIDDDEEDDMAPPFQLVFNPHVKGEVWAVRGFTKRRVTLTDVFEQMLAGGVAPPTTIGPDLFDWYEVHVPARRAPG